MSAIIKLLSRLHSKIRDTSTYHLLNYIYLTFSLPFLIGSACALIILIPNKVEVSAESLSMFVFSSVIFGVLGFAAGGIVIVVRQELPPYMPFSGLRGKSAMFVGTIQIVISLVVATYMVVAGINLE